MSSLGHPSSREMLRNAEDTAKAYQDCEWLGEHELEAWLVSQRAGLRDQLKATYNYLKDKADRQLFLVVADGTR